jgi:hypothetical protein
MSNRWLEGRRISTGVRTLSEEEESEHGSTWRRGTSATTSGSATAACATAGSAAAPAATAAGLAVDAAAARIAAARRGPAVRDAVMDGEHH